MIFKAFIYTAPCHSSAHSIPQCLKVGRKGKIWFQQQAGLILNEGIRNIFQIHTEVSTESTTGKTEHLALIINLFNGDSSPVLSCSIQISDGKLNTSATSQTWTFWISLTVTGNIYYGLRRQGKSSTLRRVSILTWEIVFALDYGSIDPICTVQLFRICSRTVFIITTLAITSYESTPIESRYIQERLQDIHGYGGMVGSLVVNACY